MLCLSLCTRVGATNAMTKLNHTAQTLYLQHLIVSISLSITTNLNHTAQSLYLQHLIVPISLSITTNLNLFISKSQLLRNFSISQTRSLSSSASQDSASHPHLQVSQLSKKSFPILNLPYLQIALRML